MMPSGTSYFLHLGISDREKFRDQMEAYFTGKGTWNELFPEFAQGKKLYEDNCVECHGKNGEGKDDKFYPKIQGQHYAYMMRQFEWIRDGKRRNANPDMVEQIKNFSDKDMEMVVNYVSRIKVLKKALAPSLDWQNPDYD